MEEHKETSAYMVSKGNIAYLKDYGLLDHIKKSISNALADKIVQIIDTEDEIALRQTDLEAREYPPTNSIEYRRSIIWSSIVRCKDCKHNPEVDEFGDICPFVDSDGYVKEFPNDEFFCKRGERRE